jgi:hypothetical protein
MSEAGLQFGLDFCSCRRILQYRSVAMAPARLTESWECAAVGWLGVARDII